MPLDFPRLMTWTMTCASGLYTEFLAAPKGLPGRLARPLKPLVVAFKDLHNDACVVLLVSKFASVN